VILLTPPTYQSSIFPTLHLRVAINHLSTVARVLYVGI
jgi:hypothetical protein